jgi:cobalt/nickel transport system permease protein
VHIPDGFLATPVWLGLDALAIPAVALAARRAQSAVEENRAPLLGVMGAFVFAAQMINFPVGTGTSAHLVGAALLAIALGPSAAVVVMTAILALQAFVFQDGGVLALGANVFNMACAGVLSAWIPYRLWSPRFPRAAVAIAGAASVLASALLAITELLASGIRIPPAALWLSLTLFVVSAAVEGGITLAVVAAIGRLSPRLVRRPAPAPAWVLPAFAAAAVLLASAGVLVASSAPDGLQRLALRLGLAPRALFPAPLADYQAAFLNSPWTAKAAAGLAGIALVGGLCFGLGRAAARRRSA